MSDLSNNSPIATTPILYIDTTSDRLMLGLSCHGRIIYRYEELCDSHRYHSALMTPAIQGMLSEAGLTAHDLSAVAVNTGPGSFTGVRTGIITARTMAQFLPVRVFAFNSFEILALPHNVSNDNQSIPTAVYLNARRGKSFHALLHYKAEGPVYNREPDLIMLPDDFTTIESFSTTRSPRIIASDSLRDFLPEQASIQYFSKMPFTPECMLTLIQRYAICFERPWQAVLPLYLQEPSITLKKPPTPLQESF